MEAKSIEIRLEFTPNPNATEKTYRVTVARDNQKSSGSLGRVVVTVSVVAD